MCRSKQRRRASISWAPHGLFLAWNALTPFVAASPVFAPQAESSSAPDASSSAAQAPYLFDIPAQSLDRALQLYGEISGRPVVFDDLMVSSRTSMAVQGTYTPQVALQVLLKGTGITADYVETGDKGMGAFVLRVADPMGSASFAPSAGDEGTAAASRSYYDGLVQTRLWDALCRNSAVAPLDYRAVVQFDVDPAGGLTDVRLVLSSGNRDRDQAIKAMFEHTRFDDPPPGDLVQPISIVIRPAEATRQCRQNR